MSAVNAAPAVGLACLAALCSAAAPGQARETVEHVITFDRVKVRALPRLTGTVDRPAAEPGAEDYRGAVTIAPGGALGFAPGPGRVNPSFVERGFVVEAFWAIRTGTPEGRFVAAHFHPKDLATGFEAQHWGYRDELHGVHIRALDGRAFRLKSLRYRVTRNRELRDRPFSIDGFSNFSVNVLISASFDPRLSVRTQFTAFPIGLALGNDPDLPFLTLPILGVERVTQLFVASSASVDLDDIVLEAAPVSAADAPPEPAQPDGETPQEEER
ncbi:MAG: hypothetical protein HYV93_07945 [Candidatus Rokubacteria bacterium]|nr:hypothetical protein [Candidatus Rokubacteria bacterium]